MKLCRSARTPRHVTGRWPCAKLESIDAQSRPSLEPDKCLRRADSIGGITTPTPGSPRGAQPGDLPSTPVLLSRQKEIEAPLKSQSRSSPGLERDASRPIWLELGLAWPRL